MLTYPVFLTNMPALCDNCMSAGGKKIKIHRFLSVFYVAQKQYHFQMK